MADAAAAAKRTRFAAVAREGAGYAGCALVAFGAWEVYAPAGAIVLGALLVAFAVFAPKSKAAGV